MRQLIFKLLPRCLKDWLREVKEKQDLAKSNRLKREKTISKDEVRKVLDLCEIDSDIYLHTSLRKIGYAIEGGKEFIADVICDYVGLDKHTLLVSALPFRTTMKEFLDTHDELDIATAPNAMGAVNNIIMGKEGAVRSLHPTHSTVAVGKEAKEYVAEHHLDKTPFGSHSPYYKLMQKNGKILLFGVDLDSMTFTHVIEDLLGDLYPVKVYTDTSYKVDVKDFDGKVYHVTTTCHDPDASLLRKCNSIREDLIASGAMKAFPLGTSEVSIIDAKGYVITVAKLLLQGKSIYGSMELTEEAKNRLNAILNTI